jgi:hypothetical protein
VYGFFFDQAHGRIIRVEQYFNRIFGGLYTERDRDSERSDLRSVESITGEFIREWESSFVIMSEENPELEKVWKRISIYDFNFRILELRKRNNRTRTVEEDKYGLR